MLDLQNEIWIREIHEEKKGSLFDGLLKTENGCNLKGTKYTRNGLRIFVRLARVFQFVVMRQNVEDVFCVF
jgi:hypothetical protein